LLKAGYIVIVAVPQVKEAEGLERRLSGLPEKSALRVLIYDPEDVGLDTTRSGIKTDPVEQHIPAVPAISHGYSHPSIPGS
jgi:hypothetical protein